jgi:TolB-like protein
MIGPGPRRIAGALLLWSVVAVALLRFHDRIATRLHLPPWALVVALGIGFPASVMLAWTLDGRGGRPRSSSRTGSPGEPSSVPIALAVLVLLGFAAAAPGLIYFFVWPAAIREPAVHAGVPSIAVLPFTDMSPGKDQEYFADGVAEEILNSLAQVEGLRVAGRTSSFAFKGKGEDVAAIAKRLRVTSVLEGSVRKEGNRVRITAQLVNAAEGYHLWSRTFERDLSDVFAVQDDIARAVAEALQVRLQPSWETSIRGRRTASPDAYEHYLRAVLLLGRYRLRDTVQAQAELGQAVELDPGYGLAWSELGTAWALLSDWAAPAEQPGLQRRAMEAADKGVELAPDQADAWARRGLLKMQVAWDWGGAAGDIERALAINPRDVSANEARSRLLSVRGQLPEAITLASRVASLDPLSLSGWLRLHTLQVASGDATRAREALAQAEAVSPASYQVIVLRARAELEAERPASALTLARRPEVPEDFRFMLGALALHALGQEDESTRELEKLSGGYADTEAYQIAEVHAGRGDKDRALEWLERAWRQRDGGLVGVLPWVSPVKWNPVFRGLRGDPRFTALLGKLNLPVD